MENKEKTRRSVSFGGRDKLYRTEEINKIIKQAQNQNDLMVFYIDFIRNYKPLTEDMIKNIKTLDDNSKMLLITEYNIAIKALNYLL